MLTSVLTTACDWVSKLVTTTFKTDKKISHLYQPYGTVFFPSNNSPAICATHNIDTQSSTVFAENPYDFAPVQSGEKADGNPISKCNIHYKNDGSIVVTSLSNLTVISTGAVDVTAPTVTITSGTTTITGNISVSGNITCAGTISDSIGALSSLRTVYNSHTHTSGGDTTSSPSVTA
jgi:phage baseplate assembly protein gpV